MTLALGIVIGFAWERAFHAGIHDISIAMSFSESAGDYFVHMMTWAMIVIVTPAWIWFVYPMVEHCEEDGHGKYKDSLENEPEKKAAEVK